MRTKKWMFISRHQPTPEQHELLKSWNDRPRFFGRSSIQVPAVQVELVWVGDIDAFSDDELTEKMSLYASDKTVEGVICVHPLVAMVAARLGLPVGSFRNANRAPEGAPPTFVPVEFKAIWPCCPPGCGAL